MKLYVTHSGSGLLVDLADAGAIAALAAAVPCNTEGWGDSKQYVPVADAQLTFELVQDSKVGVQPDALKELIKSKAASETRWLDMYNERNAAVKRAEAAEAKLKEISAQAS